MRFFLSIAFFCLGILSSGFAQISSVGLLAEYPFNDNALDLSGNNQHGTIYGAANTLDRFGTSDAAYDFDGSSGYIEIPGGVTMNPSFPFAISLWVKLDYIDPTYNRIIYRSDEVVSTYSGFWIGQLTSGKISAAYGDGTGLDISDRVTKISNTVLNTTDWYHIAAVFNGHNDIDLYINCEEDPGPMVGSGGTVVVLGNNGVVGKNLGPSTTTYLDGKVDDIRLYNRELGSNELQYHCFETPCMSTVIDTVTVYNYVSVTDTLVLDVDLTSIPGPVDNTILVYPNPTTDIIYINTGNYGVMSDHSIRILSSTGALVYQSGLTQSQLSVDVSSFGATGLYFIEVLDPNAQTIITRHILLQ